MLIRLLKYVNNSYNVIDVTLLFKIIFSTYSITGKLTNVINLVNEIYAHYGNIRLGNLIVGFFQDADALFGLILYLHMMVPFLTTVRFPDTFCRDYLGARSLCYTCIQLDPHTPHSPDRPNHRPPTDR